MTDNARIANANRSLRDQLLSNMEAECQACYRRIEHLRTAMIAMRNATDPVFGGPVLTEISEAEVKRIEELAANLRNQSAGDDELTEADHANHATALANIKTARHAAVSA
jgi:hypothetical protein